MPLHPASAASAISTTSRLTSRTPAPSPWLRSFPAPPDSIPSRSVAKPSSSGPITPFAPTPSTAPPKKSSSTENPSSIPHTPSGKEPRRICCFRSKPNAKPRLQPYFRIGDRYSSSPYLWKIFSSFKNHQSIQRVIRHEMFTWFALLKIDDS